ncbi:MAG: MFS transporter [Dehalococcoidia bacterium]|nr:MFS transporter [Dehalococcoidia bacterium]
MQVRLASWKKTLYIVWLTQFIAISGGGLVFPFLPLYIKELGVESTSSQALYAGLSNMTFGIAMFVFSPIWGALADRYGRKKMLLRSYFAATIIMTMPAFVTNVEQFLGVRLLQGAFTGTVPAAASLIAASTPPEHVAYAMGLLQVALSIAGTAGPLIGGFLADAVGLKASFIVCGAAFGFGGLLLLFGVKEDFVRPAIVRGPWEGFVADIKEAASSRSVMTMVGFLFLVNGSLAFARPIIPLFVDLLDPASGGIKESGYAFAALAVTSIFAALAVGNLGSRFGPKKLLVITLAGASLAYMPVATAGSIAMLIFAMGVLGLFSGGSVPAANALLSINSPSDKQGSAFGLAGSGNALAMAIMPLLGGLVAASLGIRAVFLVLGVMTLVISALAAVLVPDRRQPQPITAAAADLTSG